MNMPWKVSTRVSRKKGTLPRTSSAVKLGGHHSVAARGASHVRCATMRTGITKKKCEMSKRREKRARKKRREARRSKKEERMGEGKKTGNKRK